jgi:hypothetical protein
MSIDIAQAGLTAVNAGNAMVKLVDFSIAALEQMTRAVSKHANIRLSRTDPIHFSMHESPTIHQYTHNSSPAEVRLPRYLFTYMLPKLEQQKAIGGRCYPFLLIPLLNSENRPPTLLYGLIKNMTGRERSEEAFLQHFMLFLSERLNEARESGSKTKNGWAVSHTLKRRMDSQTISADLVFDECQLFDLDGDNLPKRAASISGWILDRLEDLPLPEKKAAKKAPKTKAEPAKAAKAKDRRAKETPKAAAAKPKRKPSVPKTKKSTRRRP